LFHCDITYRRGLSCKNRIDNLSIFIFLSFFCITLFGCQAPPSANATMDTSKISDQISEGLLEQYVIGVGDLLQISVWRNPDLSASVVVLPSGDISVPLVGDIKAAGSTTEQLAETISKGLDSFVRQPSVTVSVHSAVSAEYLQRVRITGAVNKPLSIPYRRGLTVLDFVLQAGGLTPFANADRALLYRQEGEELKVYPVRLDDILAKGDLETNYALLPLDIVTVPENSF
jgi:polysaccharide export outer membrane protein